MRELTQTFHFPGASADRLAHVPASAPLVGEASIFGKRNVRGTATADGVRRAVGFEPAPIPLLRFDVEMRQETTRSGSLVLLEFSQPERSRPYLAGQFIWELVDEPDETAVLHEHINTTQALAIVSSPLHGPRPSLRRELFFRGGHQRLMKDTASNLHSLLAV